MLPTVARKIPLLWTPYLREMETQVVDPIHLVRLGLSRLLVLRFQLIVGDRIYCDIGDPMVRLGQSRLLVFRFQWTVGDRLG